MKNFKTIIIGIACICLILVGFFFFTKENTTTEKNLTEIEKLIVRDLEEDYPKTPREVVKFYNRIIISYYGGEAKNNQLEKLADQTLQLLDEDLLIVNPRDEYIDSVLAEVKEYKKLNKRVVSADVCDSKDVIYVDDVKEGTTEVDKLAYVNTSYFTNTDGEFAYSYQQFVLRQDDDGKWKILSFYKVEGEPFQDE